MSKCFIICGLIFSETSNPESIDLFGPYQSYLEARSVIELMLENDREFRWNNWAIKEVKPYVPNI